MVEPITLSLIAVIVAGISGMYHIGSELYHKRYSPFYAITYPRECPEYATLFAILSHQAHVAKAPARRREFKRLTAESPLVLNITCVAMFTNAHHDRPFFDMRLCHDGNSIRVFSVTDAALTYWISKVTHNGVMPSDFILTDCSL
jgi:hypothetical protein